MLRVWGWAGRLSGLGFRGLSFCLKAIGLPCVGFGSCAKTLQFLASHSQAV